MLKYIVRLSSMGTTLVILEVASYCSVVLSYAYHALYGKEDGNDVDDVIQSVKQCFISSFILQILHLLCRQMDSHAWDRSPGTIIAVATTPAGEAARDVKLSPLLSTDERDIGFKEDGSVPWEEVPPKKMTARERWYWAFDKIIAKLNVSTQGCTELMKLSVTICT